MKKHKVIIASDSFKGSLSSKEVAEAICKGFNRIESDFEVKIFEIADGGEGTVEVVTKGLSGKILEFDVLDIFRNKTKAIMGVLDDKTCILETASPCGLDKLKNSELDPFRASSYGLGEMVINALDQGFKKIYIGLGGSAVNDGGIGLAKALGVKILDENNKEVDDGAIGLSQVRRIDISELDSRIVDTSIIILSDVKNVLIGDKGATAVFGPQKGIKLSEIKKVDSWMKNYGEKLEEVTGKNILNIESGGAAGGIGATLIALTNAKVSSGIDTIMDLLFIEEEIKTSDIIFTGEGRMDGQSLNGKAPVGIAKIAKKYNKPVIAIVGSKDEDYESVLDQGIDIVLDIVNRPMELENAIENAEKYISQTAYAAMKLYLSWQDKLVK